MRNTDLIFNLPSSSRLIAILPYWSITHKNNRAFWLPYQAAHYGGRFQAFLSYFPVTFHLFPNYFSNISYFPTISYSFLKNFPFPTISGLFLTSQLNFSTISHLLLSYFSLLNYFSVTS